LATGPVFDMGFSPREARRRAFIALGPGWAGFKLTSDSEEDGDEAAQAHGGADKARSEECDLAVDARRPREISLEALEAFGEEFADPASLPQSDEDGEMAARAFVRQELAAAGIEYREDDDEDGDDYPDDEDANPRAVMVFKDGQFMVAPQEWHQNGAPRRAWRRRVEDCSRNFGRNLVAAVGQRAERLAKTVEGTVVRHADYGIFVQSGRDVGLVHVDTVRGMGSRNAALAFLHGNTVGMRVRVIPGKFRAEKQRWDLELF